MLWQVFEISPSFYVVELRKTHGDSTLYRQVPVVNKHLLTPAPRHAGFCINIYICIYVQLCAKLSNELGVSQSQLELNVAHSTSCGLQTLG